MRDFTEQELVRRKKVEKLKAQGLDPFGHRIDVTSDSKTLKNEYEQFSKEELATKNINVLIAGRIMTKREKGKAGFMHIQDKYGQIQIYMRQDSVSPEDYERFLDADIGDIVGIEGEVFKTNVGELTVKADKYIHLVKSLKPLPEKYHGLIDMEERFRRRYVDLIVNEKAREIAFLRPKVIRAIQSYLDSIGYTEVETPILETVSGGAAARPFITHHNTLGIDMYLRIATELPLKRLLVGGMDAVYEIGRLFRNEGMDKVHNPEFTSIELYKAYSDMFGMMEITENIINHVVEETIEKSEITYLDKTFSLKPPFKRVHMVDAIKKATGIDFFANMTFAEAKKLANDHDITVEPHYGYGHIVNEFFERYVEDTIIEPTFVYGHPVEISPLAKKGTDERFTERFELFICGNEYANAFTELNDPIDQYERFENQVKEKALGNEEATEMDIDFVEALEYGMPPAGGLGIGIDRLVMLLANTDSIREVILFPHMKKRD